ncbi:hypothetical protein AB4Z52_31395 [Rhizobium sp. 2YAF20]|uniref:hypothetical protein n=1 Tax=Rhizobium sp. 2YAF20 TaxID=3233027 RepID=UPI003F959F5F
MLFRTDYNPVTMAFINSPKKDLKEFFRGFMDSKPACIADLTSKVNQSIGYESWEPNFSPDSLDMLGTWLSMQLKTRDMTTEEIDATEKSMKYPMEFEKKVLTSESRSLVVKTGMYFGEVFVKNYPSLQWELITSGRKMGDTYGQPVVTGFKVSPLNPVWIVGVFASGYAFDRKKSQLREMYQVWVGDIAD